MAFSNAINDIHLLPQHIDELQKTPFWHLFEAFITNKVKHERNFGKISKKIIENYKAKDQTFKIEQENIQLQALDVSLIVGIINGSRDSDLSYSQKIHSNFIDKRFSGDSEIKISKIKRALDEAAMGRSRDDVRDVCRLLCLLLIATLLFASGGDRLKWKFVYYIENIERMREFDWCTATLSELTSSMNKAHNDASKVTGCTTLLQVPTPHSFL